MVPHHSVFRAGFPPALSLTSGALCQHTLPGYGMLCARPAVFGHSRLPGPAHSGYGCERAKRDWAGRVSRVTVSQLGRTVEGSVLRGTYLLQSSQLG